MALAGRVTATANRVKHAYMNADSCSSSSHILQTWTCPIAGSLHCLGQVLVCKMCEEELQLSAFM